MDGAKTMASIHEFISGLSKEAKQIFRMIQKKGPLSKSELLSMTGAKLTTLNRIMAPLEESSLVVQSEIGESSGGRKPILYDVNPYQYYVVGVDLSRTYAQISIVNLKMKLLFSTRFDLDETYTPAKTLETISHAISEGFRKLPEKQVILGIGVGTVGPLDRAKGRLIDPIHFLTEGWDSLPILDLLAETFDLPMLLDNGANTAVLAEYYFGAAKGLPSIAYFHCGMGIRTGMLTGNTILRTMQDAEDCFAHMIIDVDGKPCTCGNYGCVEAYASIPSIQNTFISLLKKGRRSRILKPIQDIHYMDICLGAEAGDALAREVLLEAATGFGVGLANYINLLNPQGIILSGPLIRHSSLFYETSKEIAHRKCYGSSSQEVFFHKEGFLKENAISIGAAAMVVEALFSNEMLQNTKIF